MSHIFSGIALLLLLGTGAGCPGPTQPIPEGRFLGQPSRHVGSYEVHFLAADRVAFLHLVSQHLPPTELERDTLALSARENTWCLEPAPSTIEACFEIVHPDTIRVQEKAGGQWVTLVRFRP